MIGNIGVAALNRLSQAKHLLTLLIAGILLFAVSPANAQLCASAGHDGSPGTITGVVNTYYPGTASVAAAGKTITLGAATGSTKPIGPGDLLLVIQMQDATIDSVDNDNHYGDGVNGAPGSGYTAANNVGVYEFVKSTVAVPLAGGTLTLLGTNSGGLINAYTNANFTSTQGQRKFQVVRVPQYVTVTLSSGLSARAWNGSTGGILALDVAGNVTLNNSTVNVTGLGFRGGAGLRLQGAGGSLDDYRNTAPTSATTTTGFHGSKGEGIAGTPRYVWNSTAVVDTGVEGYPNGSMGRGAPGNAGGGGTDGDPDTANPGGNDENSGGGGGGNGGAGGNGGRTWSSNRNRGGAGGVVFAQGAASRVVMGGGGGAGTLNNDTAVGASSGAAGGGIVIIRAAAFVGTGVIIANGAAAYNLTANDGGGGGGAGGSVVVLLQGGTLAGLTVNANGGRGGDAWHSQAPGGDPGERHGPGGGGGGGLIFLSKVPAGSTVTGGANGVTTTDLDAFDATPGANGTVLTNLATQLPGAQAGYLCPLSTTAIEMVGYGASRRGNGKVLVEWETGYEVDNLGFNIYRQEGGERVRINRSLIAGSALFAAPGTKLTAGRSYMWRDNLPEDSSSVYWLEEIDLSGVSIWHGPIAVGSGTLPKSKYEMAGNEISDAKTIEEMNAEAVEQGPTLPVEESAKLVMAQSVQSVQSGKIKIDGVLVPPNKLTLGSEAAVKLSVKREGYYRVTKAELVAGGMSSTVDPRNLQLFVDGQEQAINVVLDEKGQLTGIEFYGIGIDTPTTDNHVYWLTWSAAGGKRIPRVLGTGGVAGAASYAYAVERRDRSIYVSGIRNGDLENFFGAVVVATPVDQVINVPHVDRTGTATLEVAMQGLSLLSHHVSVSLNGTFLGAIDFTAQANGIGTFSVEPGLLQEGQNTITVVGQTGILDVSLVDRILVSYKHTYSADGNALKLTANAQQQLTVGGFTSKDIRVIDVTSPGAPQEVVGAVGDQDKGYTITFAAPGTGNRSLVAFAGDQVRVVAGAVSNVTTNWRDVGNGADLVILTHKSVLDSFRPLQSLRAKQGLKVALVDVEDVYDEFSYGNKTPQAIKDFLAYARGSWRTAPRYALMGGGASFDPKNYMGQGANDLVPTKLIDTGLMQTASDDWFADPNNEGLATMAIGRLPANNADEATTMVTKIVGYETSVKSNGITLTADENNNFDFEASVSQLRPLIPAGVAISEIDRGRVGTATAKQQLLDAIAIGQKIVNYAGHGASMRWSGDLLTSDDARALTNANHLPLFVMMTCLNGLFQEANLDGLAPALMKAKQGGAIAVWASSALTDPTLGQSVLNQQLYRLLFTPAIGKGALTLGEATMKAKAAVSDFDIRRTWILFGDPSMVLK